MAKYLVMALALALSVRLAAVELVRGGQPCASIGVADGAPASVRFAAEELRKYIAAATGAELPVISEKAANIYPNLVKVGYGVALEEAGRFDFAVAARGNELTLCGFDQPVKEFAPGSAAAAGMITVSTGTLFAVYDFLDRELGVRFLWPGETGTYVPRRKSLEFKDFARKGRPVLDSATFRLVPELSDARGWHNPENRRDYLAGCALWTIRHRFAVVRRLRGGHAFTGYWKRFSATDPGFFALLPDGTRRPLAGDGSGAFISMCVSNPELHRRIIADFSRNPQEILSVCENDTVGLCTCGECRSWDVPQPGFAVNPYWGKGVIPTRNERFKVLRAGEDGGRDGSGASLTDRYAKFYLKIYDMAAKIRPDVVVYGHAYANFAMPPLETKLHRNIAIGYVGWPYYPFTEEEMARAAREWNDWAASGPSMVLRPNSTHSGHNMPLQYARKLGEAYRNCFDSGAMKAADFDMLRGEFAVQGPMLYTMARLTARPDLTVERILDEYFGAFGPAADAVRAYFDYCEQVSDAVTAAQWEKWKGELREISFKNWLVVADRIFTADFFRKARALLNKARAAASGDRASLARVEFLQYGLEHAELTVAVLQGKRGLEAAPGDAGRAKWRDACGALKKFRVAHEDKFISNMGYLYFREFHGVKLYTE